MRLLFILNAFFIIIILHKQQQLPIYEIQFSFSWWPSFFCFELNFFRTRSFIYGNNNFILCIFNFISFNLISRCPKIPMSSKEWTIWRFHSVWQILRVHRWCCQGKTLPRWFSFRWRTQKGQQMWSTLQHWLWRSYWIT